MNFEEVCERVRVDNDGKWDLMVPRAEVGYAYGSVVISQEFANGNPSALKPTSWALTQICQRLGIPTAYFKRCPQSLQDPQVNYWAQQCTNGHGPNGHDQNGHYNGNGSNGNHHGKNELWMLRSKNDTLRGVLSDRYSRLDNEQFMGALEPVLKAPFRIDSFALSDESMHLRVIDPMLRREVLPGDDVTVGVHIANSEVGRRAVTVDAVIYRLVCSNGLIRLVRGKSLLYQRHLYVKTTQFQAVVHEALGNALTTAADWVEQLRRTTEQRVPGVDDTLERLGQRWNLSQSFREQVKQALEYEEPPQQETLYGLVNAFTKAAQSLPADDRYDMEVLAGQLVSNGLGHGLNGGSRMLAPAHAGALN